MRVPRQCAFCLWVGVLAGCGESDAERQALELQKLQLEEARARNAEREQAVASSNYRAKRTKIQADCKAILAVADAIHVEDGSYPATMDQMTAGTNPAGQPRVLFLEKTPEDPWGHAYIYTLERGKPKVRCLGSDNAEGGEGDAADVVVGRPED